MFVPSFHRSLLAQIRGGVTPGGGGLLRFVVFVVRVWWEPLRFRVDGRSRITMNDFTFL
jgi:hypothetical protein